jgi:hypothetical protein
MKKLILFFAVLFVCTQINFAQTITPEISSWVRNTTGLTGYNSLPANVQIVQYSASNVYVSCSCIPGYSIGPWTGNPNIPSNQNFVFKITRTPTKNTGALTAVGLGHVGIWSNGVSIDNADDAQTYNNEGVWHRNALVYEGVSFDNCLGHPQQGGEYHHHVNPTCLYNDKDSTHHSPIIGYMFDGFPVYGAYAYSNIDGTGAIKRMTPSYRTRSITTRTTLPDGSTASKPGPDVNATYPIGNFLQDWEYVSGLGDLDDHNGRFCKTPEYPNGTYAYFVTIDAAQKPLYPFVIGSTYYGTVQVGNTGGPSSGHVTISETTTVYNGTNSGVADLNSKIKYELMPNPTSDYLYLYMDVNSANNLTANLYDAQGKLLETKKFIQPSIAYSFDLTKYSEGIYFLHLEGAGQKTIQKIIKNK